MTLPLPSRTWTITRDRTVAQQGTSGDTNKRMTRVLVEDLITFGGMTTDFSCDSNVAGTKGDGVNRWDSDSDIVGNTPGNAHSWYVGILHGGANGYVCIDKDSSSDGGGGAPGSVYWSPAAGFTGGTTTARPTATDEQEITTSTQMWNTGNGSYTYHLWRCDTSGQESTRVACIHSTNANGPDNIITFERASSTPTAWSPPNIATFRSGGAGSVADRGAWTASGWKARVSGTNRSPILVGDTPPTTTDVDGDVLLVPVGLNDATVGRLGFVADWHMVQDGATNLSTFSDTGGLRGWIVLDEIVWPWDRSSTAGGNVAGAKLLVNFLNQSDAVAPVITLVSPTAEGNLPGTHDQAENAPLVFDVTDVEPGVLALTVHLLYSSATHGANMHTVVRRGAFQRGYSGSIATITDGFRVTINAPAGGWKGPFLLGVDAVDAAGNLEDP